MSDLTELEPEIKVLRAKARDSLPNDIVEDYDKINDDGDKIEVQTWTTRSGGEKETEHNLTAMYRPGPSTTGDVDMLVLEAEMMANGRDLDNPHIPSTVAVKDEALERLADQDLEPAWSQ